MYCPKVPGEIELQVDPEGKPLTLIVPVQFCRSVISSEAFTRELAVILKLFVLFPLLQNVIEADVRPEIHTGSENLFGGPQSI